MSEGEAFRGLVEEFVPVWLRFHPDLALARGLRTSISLPPQSDDELLALGAWLEALLVAIEEIDFGALDADDQVDLLALFGLVRAEHQELSLRDWRHRDPLRFLPIAEIYHLTLQGGDELRPSLIKLLSDMPEYLRLAQGQLREIPELVPPLLAQAALDEIEHGRCYLRELVRSSWLRERCFGCAELEELSERACDALGTFGEFLQAEVLERAAAPPGCGRDRLAFLLEFKHALPGALDRIEGALTWAEARVAAVARAPAGGEDRSSDAAESLVERCRQEVESVHSLVDELGLATLGDVPLAIRERPDCPRPRARCGDYVAAADGGGVLYLPGGEIAEGALGFALSDCLFHAWGGEHLVCRHLCGAAGRTARRLVDGTSFLHGWDLYLRERLLASGRFEAAQQRRHRELLAMHLVLARTELAVHLGELSPAEAEAHLKAVPLLRARASALLTAMARDPGQWLAAILGWRLLSLAREMAEQSDGAAFDQRAFHDALIEQGAIPVTLALRGALGEAGASHLIDLLESAPALP